MHQNVSESKNSFSLINGAKKRKKTYKAMQALALSKSTISVSKEKGIKMEKDIERVGNRKTETGQVLNVIKHCHLLVTA